MTDILCIHKRYWKLLGNCDPLIAKEMIKTALRKANTKTDQFITMLNSLAGFQWVGEELFTRIPEHYSIIYSSRSCFMWIITLTGRKVELREKVPETRRSGHAWQTIFNVAFTKSWFGVIMVKRVHFCENDEVLCNQLGPKAKRYHYKRPSANDNTKVGRRLKTTADPDQVTCEHCKEKLSSRSKTFVCSTCGQMTETFIITETVTMHSSVTARFRGRRTLLRTEQRKLISITCPICNATVPATENWNKISCIMKVDGLKGESLTLEAEAPKV